VTWLQVVVLAIVQGLTEFLPISSSGHLVLVPSAAGWTDQGLAFDVAVHFGSLLAVCLFFRDDIFALVRGSGQLLSFNYETPEARIALALGIGTVPAAVAGLALAGWIEANLRSPTVIVGTLSAYAIIMVLADRYGRRERNVADVTLRDALVIGCAQALALVPGTSRSGVTISAGRILGFDRRDAARFSFLLSVPVILLATVYELGGLLISDEAVAWGQLWPFALYRIVLAAVILVVLV
jgi:undecaprenyl-diphosphatase